MAQPVDGWLLTATAARFGNEHALTELIAAGAPVQVGDSEGENALFASMSADVPSIAYRDRDAFAANRLACVTVLCQQSGLLASVNEEGYSALAQALHLGGIKTATVLASNGAELIFPGMRGQTMSARAWSIYCLAVYTAAALVGCCVVEPSDVPHDILVTHIAEIPDQILADVVRHGA